MNYLVSTNPWTGKEVARYNSLNNEEIAAIAECSLKQFRDYKETSFSYRKERMMKVAKLLRDREKELALIITSEMGKLLSESKAEVNKCAWVCEYYAENAENFLKPRYEISDARESYVLYEPIGPVLAVMPWNFPFWQVFRFSAPTIMAGNTALLKHASNVQGCARAIEKLYKDAGFPTDVFRNLCIPSSKVENVIIHPAVKAVTLTGSEPAGAAVASTAARVIKKSVLELGGNNAFIVLNDSNLDEAVNVAVIARLINAGQSCIAAKRFIIESGIYDKFLELLIRKIEVLVTGDPMNEKTQVAPLVSVGQAKEVQSQIEKSVSLGATLVKGGTISGTICPPAILTDVVPGMPVFDEETFGPVFAISRAHDREHAMKLANRSGFGLGLQLFTSSEESAEYFIKNAEEGAVFVNGMVKSDPRLPFGGVKRSGFGRELSREGILEFMNAKTVWIGG